MDEQAVKRCGRCGLVKALDEFTPKGKGRQSYCRPCVSAYFREYYQKNKATYVARATRYHRKIRALLREAKNKPCADCGRRFPYYVMDFDHRESEAKLCNLAELSCHQRISLAKLLEEIAKCDVVCANCHRERTYQRTWRFGRKSKNRCCSSVVERHLGKVEVLGSSPSSSSRIAEERPGPEAGRGATLST
jgi:hypothetical protein